MNKSLLKSNLLLLVTINSANLFAFLFQFIMGRYLDLESFGILTATSSFALIFIMFFEIIPYLLVRYLVLYRSDSRQSQSIFLVIFYFSLALIIIISFIVLVFQKNLAVNMRLTDYAPIYFMLAFVASGVILNVFFGTLRGVERFYDYAIGASLLQFVKLVLGILFVVILSYSYNGALSAMVISNIILIMIVYLKIKNSYSLFPNAIISLPRKLYRSIAIDSIPLGMMLLLFAVLTNIDMIAVKHFVSSDKAGEYAAVSILSKIAIFLPSVLISVLFPKVVSEDQEGKNSKATFMMMVLMTILIEVLFCIFLSLYSREIITLLFGARYSNASNYLLELTIAMGLFATANVFFHFFTAKQHYTFLYYSYSVTILFGMFLWLAEGLSVGMIVDIIFYWAFFLLLVNSLIYFRNFRT